MQVLQERGVDEGQLDAEVQAHLAEAARQDSTDEGVSAVLLLAAQAELGKVRLGVVKVWGGRPTLKRRCGLAGCPQSCHHTRQQAHQHIHA